LEEYFVNCEFLSEMVILKESYSW